MPDTWEYPWFAAWDLAFHCAPLALVDVDFAKEQVELLLHTRYMHPNGQIPAYEWNFGDVNPPVTAWAALFVYEREAEIRGEGDREFLDARLPAAADELHLVGQPQGPRRPQPLPGRLPRARQHRDLRPLGAAAGRRDARAGGRHGLDGPLLPVDAADRRRAGTARPRVRRHGAEVRRAPRVDHDRGRPPSASGSGARRTASSTTSCGRPTAPRSRSRCARSSGCCRCARPPCSTPTSTARHPALIERVRALRGAPLRARARAAAHLPGPSPEGTGSLALVDERRLRRMLATMLDEEEFLGPHGIRAVSRRHARARRASSTWDGRRYSVALPAGRVRHRHVRRQLQLARARVVSHEPRRSCVRCSSCTRYYGDRLKVECPTGSGRELDLREVAVEIGRRLAATFLEDDARPPAGVRRDRDVPGRPVWHDLLLVPRVLPRRQRRRPRREPPDGLDRDRRAAVYPARRLMRLPRAAPRIYEINTAVLARTAGRGRGRPLGLGEVPAAEWDALAALPVDAVWLMGVWERSPAGLRIALADPGARLRQPGRPARPAAPRTSSARRTACATTPSTRASAGPTRSRRPARRLAERGLAAGARLRPQPRRARSPVDCACGRSASCRGSEEELAQRAGGVPATAGGIVAQGRDPYFPPWPDVVQLNAYAPALREAVAGTLRRDRRPVRRACVATWRCS